MFFIRFSSKWCTESMNLHAICANSRLSKICPRSLNHEEKFCVEDQERIAKYVKDTHTKSIE
jgi:hypothetical protein